MTLLHLDDLWITLLLWPKNRVEARLNPGDIIYEPASFDRLRTQMRDVHEKMDREKQLLDRYLDSNNTRRQ